LPIRHGRDCDPVARRRRPRGCDITIWCCPPPAFDDGDRLGLPKPASSPCCTRVSAAWLISRQRLKADKAKRRLGKIILENHSGRPIRSVDGCSCQACRPHAVCRDASEGQANNGTTSPRRRPRRSSMERGATLPIGSEPGVAKLITVPGGTPHPSWEPQLR
jgi:hypothetical protein